MHVSLANIIPTPPVVIQNFQPQIFSASVQPEKKNPNTSTMIAPPGVNQNMQPQIYNASVQSEKNNNFMSIITPTHCVNQFMVDIRLHVFKIVRFCKVVWFFLLDMVLNIWCQIFLRLA